MYNKNEIKAGLKKVRRVFKEMETQNFRFYIYKGEYAGWPWSLTITEREGTWRYYTYSVTATFVDGSSAMVLYRDMDAEEYKDFTAALAVAAHEVIESHKLWADCITYEWPVKKDD